MILHFSHTAKNILKKTYIPALLLIFSGCQAPVVEKTAEDIIDEKADSVLALMNLDEKLGQLTLYSGGWAVTGPVIDEDYVNEIKAGRCGNVFNAQSVAFNRNLQKIAVEETRMHIPLIFGLDVVHGYRTTFPVSLAESCSWDLDLIQKSARYAAMEATSCGICWTFAPMVDITRDPRWGRVSEGAGEDTWLGSRIAAARVKGFQGDDLADSTTVAACIKHFAAYGAPVAGRDYNAVDMSELSLRQDYLPPYRAGVEAGAATVMASFNEIAGVPSSASHFLLTDVLRGEWGFEGFVVADYASVLQLVNHGVAADEKQAGELALNAGLDMDMATGIYIKNIKKSVEEGAVSMETINTAVKRILRVKFQLGLFDDPYRYFDEHREATVPYSPEILEHALLSAQESIVLLKNEELRGKKILPLSKKTQRIALIGPMVDDQADMLGSWAAMGEPSHAVTVLAGLKKEFPDSRISTVKGCDFHSPERKGFAEATKTALASDVVIVAIGEMASECGEANSRSDISIPGLQEELALELIKTGKPVIVLILGEKPLTFPALAEKANAIIYGWHLGTRSGDALADIISGDYNPSGKLVMSIPRNVGQVPVYYNYKSSGRPFNPNDFFTTHYIDVPNTPQYPFGYGLSYTSFEYGPLQLNSNTIGMEDTLQISFELKNTGDYNGVEVAQLYVRDMVGSVTRPVKELKGFKRVFLKKGEQIRINFSLTASDLSFYNSDLEFQAEPGDFRVFAGGNSETVKAADFKLTNN
jgi:beta-glucosidase